MNQNPEAIEPHWEIATQHNLSMSIGDSKYLLLSDNVANSCLISEQAFHIDHKDPFRRAIIKGCKDNYISRGNPIGSGRAIIMTGNL